MFKSLWNKAIKFLDAPIYKSLNPYEILDDAQGRLTSEEALKIALPKAIESGLVFESMKAKIGCRKIWLAKDNKLNRIIWMLDFGLIEIDGEKNKAEGYLKGLGSIHLDDETGEILEVFFNR